MGRIRVHFLKMGMVFFLLLCQGQEMTAYAADEGYSGHLIQATTFWEEYEGMVSFGGTQMEILAAADTAKAYENVREGIVQIHAGAYYGSGVIWEMDENKIVVISNRHLLSGFDQTGRITFYGGATTGGKLLGLCDTCDLGFVRVEAADVPGFELTALREVRRDDAAYRRMKKGDTVFTAGSADGVGNDMYEGSVADPWFYIEDFDAYMLYCTGYGKPGMSGGGTFDAFGNFVGLLTGGTAGNETASVPVQVILKEYEKLENKIQNDVGNRK